MSCPWLNLVEVRFVAAKHWQELKTQAEARIEAHPGLGFHGNFSDQVRYNHGMEPFEDLPRDEKGS